MYEQLIAERADIVSGWRKERQDTALKIAFSRIFNRLMIRLLFGSSFKDMNSGLKLYKAEVARELHLYGGMHRFIPLIATEMGYRVAECPVSHNERRYGTSKYSPMKILTEMPDLLTVFFLIKYTTRPLHFFARIGSALIALGLALPGVPDDPLDPEHPDRHEASPDVRRAAGCHRRADGLYRAAGRSDRQRESEQETGVSLEVRVGHRRATRDPRRTRCGDRFTPCPTVAIAPTCIRSTLPIDDVLDERGSCADRVAGQPGAG